MTTRSLPFRVAGLTAVLLIVIAACGGGDPLPSVREGHPSVLSGTAWRVVSIGGQVPAAGAEPTIAFSDTNAQGSGGCNSFSGSYRYDTNGGLTFGDLAMTAMACVDAPRNEIETRFMTALGQVDLASTDPRGLLVLSGSGGQILLANAAQPNPTD